MTVINLLIYYIFYACRVARKVLCLIFVERIITAKVIERFIKKIIYLSHFTVSYLTGSNSSVDALAPKAQRETLESFRSGKVSDSLGIDLQEVLAFKLPSIDEYYTVCRLTYYLQLMWLRREFMCQTAPVLFVLTYRRLFVVMSNHEDELGKVILNLSSCLRGDSFFLLFKFI